MRHAAGKAEPQELDTIEQIKRCQTNFEVFLFCQSLTRQFNYGFFSILPLSDERGDQTGELTCVSDWPRELTAKYDQKKLLADCGILKQLSQSTMPVIWSVETLRQSSPVKKITDAADVLESSGLRNNVSFSVYDAGGRRGVVSFSGKRANPAEMELMELSFAASLLYDRLCFLNPVEDSPRSGLTARERECLVWTAAGKTSGEIATILKLSEHTVTHYLGIACQKLDAVNRVHAVSKAMRAGLLD